MVRRVEVEERGREESIEKWIKINKIKKMTVHSLMFESLV